MTSSVRQDPSATSSAATAGTARGYALDNRDPRAGEHHRLLAQLLDEHTIGRLAALYGGHLALQGRHCLDVGAGGGSIAVWLAEQVRPSGTVTATDPEPDAIPASRANLAVLRHTLGTDPLPDQTYDLIHARLVLQHLPAREAILADLVRHLAPGGRIVLGDWYRPGENMVLHAADPEVGALVQRVQDTLSAQFVKAGSDRTWAPRVPGLLRELGLVNVDTRITAESWASGSPGAIFIAGTIRQLSDQLTAAGVTCEQITTTQEALLTPSGGLLLRGHVFYTTTAAVPTRS